jgi:hypothetical protein
MTSIENASDMLSSYYWVIIDTDKFIYWNAKIDQLASITTTFIGVDLVFDAFSWVEHFSPPRFQLYLNSDNPH